MARSSGTYVKDDPRFVNRRGKNHPIYKHGMTQTRIYDTWVKMKSRCYKPTDKNYPNYGGRGIKMEKKWLDFLGFYEDMGPTYREELTIERIDNNKGYTKANCKWITAAEQAKNKRSVARYSFKGEKLSIPEIADKIGLKRRTLYSRIKILKWPLERAFQV